MTMKATPRTRAAPSIRVVHAVANTLDTDPVELSPPLGAVLDPDALDSIGRSKAATTFEYAGCLVTVTADNEVRVEKSDDNSP
ncbi:hypothetical protein BRC91_09245 [Halobacteriales archaeon QS_4_62_28]|nr:MAG: hypothetical protein BRC91_09245 [Halobacteriales archaeon QS_4_62_28]